MSALRISAPGHSPILIDQGPSHADGSILGLPRHTNGVSREDEEFWRAVGFTFATADRVKFSMPPSVTREIGGVR